MQHPRTPPDARPAPQARSPLLLASLLAVAHWCWTLAPLPAGPIVRAVGTLALALLGGCVVALALRVMRSPTLPQPCRSGWRWMALAYLAELLGNALWTWEMATRGQEPAALLVDIFYLAQAPLLLIGVGQLTTLRVRRSPAFWLDVATVVLGGAMLSWTLLAPPPSAGLAETVVALAYPLATLAMLVCVALIGMQGRGSSRPDLLLLAGGLLASVAASVAVVLLDALATGPARGAGIFWSLGLLLVAAAADRALRLEPSSIAAGPEPEPLPLSFLAAVLGYGLLIVLAVRGGGGGVLLLLAVALSVVALTRQVITLRQNGRLRAEQVRQRGAQLLQQAEERLIAERALVQAVIDHTPLSVFAKDHDGRFLLVNRHLSSLLGLTPEEMTGRSQSDFFPEAAVERWRAEDDEVRATGQPIVVEEKAALEARIFYQTHKFPLFDADGRLYAIGAVTHDVTEARRAEAERLALQRDLLERQRVESIALLAGGIAHDFNNLLTSVLGHAELLQADLPPDSPSHAEVAAITAASRRAAELTSQLLAYAGKGRFVIQPLDLNQLVREMADLLRVSVGKGCRLQLDLADELPAVVGDASQLRQAVLNLVVNASEAIGGQPGTIEVRTDGVLLERARLDRLLLGGTLDEGGYVQLSVADSGAGMDEATQAEVFEPFFSTKFTGRGLGLAAVHGIVRAHQGALEVVSAPGQGAVFTFWLPAGAAAAPAATALAPAARRASGTALVIDDEADVRVVLQRLLEQEGYRVVAAADGAAGLDLVRTGIPELAAVLCDLTMPGMPGDRVARAVRSERPELALVLMSGYGARQLARDNLDIGAAVLQKPFTRASVRAALDQAASATLERPPGTGVG